MELNLTPEVEIPEDTVPLEEVAKEPPGVSMYAGLVDKIKPIHEKPPFLKMLLYGDPGVGKTVLAAQAPKALVVDAEHGSRSLLNHEETKNIPTLPITKWEEIEDLFWALHDEDPFFDQFKTIVIDSITELQKRNLDLIVKQGVQKDPNRNPYLPFLQDYGINNQVMRRLIVNFRDLRKNLIVTAHAVEDKDEREGFIYMRPAVTPKLSETIIGVMDLVGYMTMREEKDEGMVRYMQVHPSRNVKAKCRIGGLEPIIKQPTFQMLLDAATK